MLAILLFFVMSLSVGARAQTESPSIRGTITDLTGASVTGATVHLADVDRGGAAGLKTGKDGAYTVRDELDSAWAIRSLALSEKDESRRNQFVSTFGARLSSARLFLFQLLRIMAASGADPDSHDALGPPTERQL